MKAKSKNTAITRKNASLPLRTLINGGYINKRDRILDYGCGKGGDVEWLRANKYKAHGYDPFQDDYKKLPDGEFDAVLLIYVVNTVHGRDYRQATIRGAWGKVKPGGFLYVVSRTKKEINENAKKGKWTRDGDGFISSHERFTFQKGHNLQELHELTRELCSCERISLPGRFTNLVLAKRRWT